MDLMFKHTYNMDNETKCPDKLAILEITDIEL